MTPFRKLAGTRRSRLWTLGVAGATTVLVAGATVLLNVVINPAGAATIDTATYYVLTSRHGSKAIDVSGASTANLAAIIQNTRTEATSQQFQFIATGDGYYRLRARHSGKVIDIEAKSKADGANVVQYTDNNAANQQFQAVDTSGGYVKLINRNSGKALTVVGKSSADGAKLTQSTYADSTSQQWKLRKVGGSAPAPAPSASPSTLPSASKSATASPAPTKTATAAPTPTGTSLPAWPTETGSVKVSATTPVSKDKPFDGGMKRYYGIGDGGQSESQDPMFKLDDGAVLQNVIIGAPAGDGVHCSGSCTLRNVWWLDVGEDAATFKGGDSATYLVDGGGAKSADDKTFQHNGGGTLTIRNFQISGFGKLYRSCGNCGTQRKRTVIVQNVTATYPGKVLVGINSNYGDTATLTGITIIGDSSRKIVVCERFQGVTSGEPKSIGSGPDATYCKYTASNITYK